MTNWSGCIETTIVVHRQSWMSPKQHKRHVQRHEHECHCQ